MAASRAPAHSTTRSSGFAIHHCNAFSHLVGVPECEILLLDQRGYLPVNYQDTEHYQLTRRVLHDTVEVLKAVFADNGELFSDL
jgi:predicted ATPase